MTREEEAQRLALSKMTATLARVLSELDTIEADTWAAVEIAYHLREEVSLAQQAARRAHGIASVEWERAKQKAIDEEREAAK